MLREIKKSDAQKLAEAEIVAFREALGPFVTAAEATRMPMMFTGAKAADHPIIFVNQAFLDLTGYEEHEVLAQSFFALLERGTDPQMLTEIQTAFEGGRDLESLVRYQRKDGHALWVTLNIAPVRDADGQVAQYFASFMDVTSQKDEGDRLRRFIQRLNERIEELNNNGWITVISDRHY